MPNCFCPLFFFLLLTFTSCHKKELPLPKQSAFDSIPTATLIPTFIKEASGITDSKIVPHTLWVEEDSGHPPQLYSLNYDGSVRKKVYVKGAANRDWEDLTRSDDTLYVAETGDNNQVYPAYAIYKFAEPAAAIDTVYQFKKISFAYPDGSHDAEALLVDPSTKDIYIITKRDNPSRIYKISFPYSTTVINTAVLAGQLSFTGVVSAALAPDGKDILVKTYTAIYHYNTNGQSIEAALQTTPTRLSYVPEPQGEAVTFAQDDSGFFTLSESGLASSVNLYFYKRN
jgi:hypothetical protein